MESGETLSAIIMLEETLDDDKDKKTFGDYHEKIFQLCDMLLQV